LIKIMMGLLKPTSGRVLLNGIEIEHSPARSTIAAVMQEDTLLSGSLAENIAFFEPISDQARIRHCAALAGIHDDIERMPMKYSTLVGDMGAALSGGQKQRILLARALYAKPKILFLDEATSHLDSVSEKHAHMSLAELRITRIIVAHRNETLALADVVLTLDDLDRPTSPLANGSQENSPNVTRIAWGNTPS
jgi:ATP-binding cassette, subfamily B, bacterial CvaB/MchF/RaxB